MLVLVQSWFKLQTTRTSLLFQGLGSHHNSVTSLRHYITIHVCICLRFHNNTDAKHKIKHYKVSVQVLLLTLQACTGTQTYALLVVIIMYRLHSIRFDCCLN